MINAIHQTVNGNGNSAYARAEFSGEAVELTPHIGDLTAKYIDFCRQVETKTCSVKNTERIAATNEFRKDLIPKSLVTEEELALLFAQSVILDLVAQGWKLKVSEPKIFLYPPVIENETKKAAKEIIRATHLLGRDIQLKEKSVEDFIKGMQRRRLTLDGWHSIYSLMRDGEDLAAKLRIIAQVTNENEKLKTLSKIVSPYLQFVEPNAICEHTGLRLGDIWRYFRHTWVNEYKSVPGRSVMILIRDAAAPNHPVIGIAALGSSVVQHKIRDKWIGWHPEKLVDEIVENPNPQIAKWLLTSVKRLIEAIYSKDLISEKIFTDDIIKKPTEEIIKKLFEESDTAIKKHRKEPQRTKHNVQKNSKIPDDFWEKEAQTFLYRSKRCKQLAKLFNIRLTFQESGFSRCNTRELQSILQKSKVKAAIAQLVRMIKAEHVGVDMLDIMVCGAIAPYNSLLGGKLVCMLLCSPEVTQYYTKRYSNHMSIIASAMKGKPVVRKPNLVLLCTTSLYGVGSSQYNRVKIPLNQIGVDSQESIVYKDLGHSHGFGTYHFSRITVQLGSNLNSRKKDGRRVNSIFGEGVNPLMRKIRESLDFVGLNSEGLLQHGNKRVTYGIKLATNFSEILLGRESKPNYLIPQKNSIEKTNKIAGYWRQRWLLQRINRPEVLEEVSKHLSSYPPSHGAIVPLEIKDEIQEQEIDFSF
jgi:Domain of unknown function (DUF4338)